jgi:hypothetical protein
MAPADCTVSEDCYYGLTIPPPPPAQKLRNLLRRASRDLTITSEPQCGEDHTALIQHYLDKRILAPGTRHIFRQLPRYINSSAGSLLLSARRSDGRLAAFGVGEFAALRTAFYLFCFREHRLAPPGSADLLLSGLMDAAGERGQTYMNLGLGINEGIRYFKRKWGAVPFLPYIETTWEIKFSGMFSRLSGFFHR